MDTPSEDTEAIYRRLGVDPRAAENFDMWRKSETGAESLLMQVREMFAAKTRLIPVASGAYLG